MSKKDFEQKTLLLLSDKKVNKFDRKGLEDFDFMLFTTLPLSKADPQVFFQLNSNLLCPLVTLYPASRATTSVARALKQDKTPVARRVTGDLFCKIRVRPSSFRSYPLWRLCKNMLEQHNTITNFKPKCIEYIIRNMQTADLKLDREVERWYPFSMDPSQLLPHLNQFM